MDRIEQTPVNTKGVRAFCLWFVTMGNQYSIEDSCVAESMDVSFNISVIQTIWICDLPQLFTPCATLEGSLHFSRMKYICYHLAGS